MTNSLLVQFAGSAIRFNSSHEGIRKTFATHLKYCAGTQLPVIANYEIATNADGRFSSRVDGGVLFSNSDFEAALWQLMQDMLLRLNGSSGTELIFHAAALAHQGKAAILCGKTASGKSSLTAWLTGLGLNYMTDEVVSSPIAGEAISGFCRSIVLKPGSAFIWKRWLKDESFDGFLRFNDSSVWIEPSLLNQNATQATAVPSLLIFPRYEPNASFQIERLTRAEALFRLLQNLVNARNFPDYGMAATSRLARRVTAYTLTYSEIETASEWIRETLQNS